MTKVSKRYLDKHLENHIFELFIKTISNLKEPSDIQDFLEDLLSPTEKIMLVKRLAIAILLSKGYTYDKIDKALKVSRATIMHVSYWLKNGKSGYRKSVERIIKDKNKEEFWDKIEETILSLSPPKAYGSHAFEKKQKAGKELVRREIKRNLI